MAPPCRDRRNVVVRGREENGLGGRLVRVRLSSPTPPGGVSCAATKRGPRARLRVLGGLGSFGPVQPCRGRPLAGTLLPLGAKRRGRLCRKLRKFREAPAAELPAQHLRRDVDRRLRAPREREHEVPPGAVTRASSSANGIMFERTTRSKAPSGSRAPRRRRPRSRRGRRARARASASLLDHARAEVDAEDLGLRIALGERERHDAGSRAEVEDAARRRHVRESEVERPEVMRADPRLPGRREPVEHAAQRAAEDPPENGRRTTASVTKRAKRWASITVTARSRTISLPSSTRSSSRGAASRDREREAAVAVLVEDQRAARRVGERSREDGVEALAAADELDPRAGRELDVLEVLAAEVERDVAEAVDDERDRADPVLPDLRLRERRAGRARPGRPAGRARRAPRRRRGARRPARTGRGRGRSATPAAASTPAFASSCASATPPKRSAAGRSSPLSGPT